MKLLFGALLCVIGVADVSASAPTAASGKIIKDGAAVFKFVSGAESTSGQTVTITATKPIFAKSTTANAAYVTSVTDNADATVATGTTANTNVGGTVLTVTFTGSVVAAGPTVITLTKDVIDHKFIQPGIYSVTMVSQADTDATAAFQIIYCDKNADAVTVGIPTLGSYLQGVDAADTTFEFGLQEAQNAGDIVTVTASQAIFHPSFAAAEAGITTLDQQLGLATAVSKKTGTPTVETDATGKIMKLKIMAAFDADTVMRLVVPTTIMNVNPATAGLVTIFVTTTESTVVASNYYPVFEAANTALLYTAALRENEVSPANPDHLNIIIFPQTELGDNGAYTVTFSTVFFSTASTALTCEATFSLIISGRGYNEDECTAVSDTTGKIVTITLSGVNKGFANFPISFKIKADQSSYLVGNPADDGAGPTLKVKASAGDTSDTTAAIVYYIFDTVATPYFVSAAVTTNTGLAAPGKMTLQFVPQYTVVGSPTRPPDQIETHPFDGRSVVFTASAAVFEASGSYPGSACQGTDCIVCTSSWRGYSTTVPCTAASDSTGKILTVTAIAASINAASYDGTGPPYLDLDGGYQGGSTDFTADRIGQVVLTNNQVNPIATAVNFTVAAAIQMLPTASRTGYTTTTAATTTPTPATATPTTATPTPTPAYSTASTTITFGESVSATNFNNLVGCAFAKTVSSATNSLTSDMCTASPGQNFTYMTGASTVNTAAAARRAGTVRVDLKVSHSLIPQAAYTAAVTNVGITGINAEMTSMNALADTGFSTADLTATGMTAAIFTHSSAAVVVPSMIAMLSAMLLVLMQ